MSASKPATTGNTIPRLPIIDLIRGTALIAMAVYHFCWDLEWYRLVPWPVSTALGWRAFAGLIAVTFLFFAGVSLTLAHANGIRWSPYLRRLAMIIAGAGVVSISTWYVQPSSFVWFGILHCIAAAGIIGLLFLRIPPYITLVCAALVIALPFAYKTPLLNNPYLAWIGLSTEHRFTVDYVPIFPWLGFPLAGIALMRIGLILNLQSRFSKLDFEGTFNRMVKFIGRHGLVFYLVHQPILISLVYLSLQLSPVSDLQARVGFNKACVVSCLNAKKESFHCSMACTCLTKRTSSRDDWREVMRNPNNQANLSFIRETFELCEVEFKHQLILPGN